MGKKFLMAFGEVGIWIFLILGTCGLVLPVLPFYIIYRLIKRRAVV